MCAAGCKAFAAGLHGEFGWAVVTPNPDFPVTRKRYPPVDAGSTATAAIVEPSLFINTVVLFIP